MAADNKTHPDNDETVIETYLTTLENHVVEEAETTNMEVREIGDDEVNIGSVTYFVDDEGRYYYQPAGDTQNIIPLADTINTEAMEQNDTQMLLGGEELQTVALVQTETDAGEMGYVLLMQEETEPIINIDEKVDQQEKSDDVLTFNDKEKDKGDATEGKEELQQKSNEIKSQEVIKNNDKHTPSIHTCNFCSYTSRRRYTILRHMKTHSQERPYKCSICERGFKSTCSLQSHVKLHTGVKSYICKHCNSPFTTSGELVRHVRYKHTHEKPHKCGECDYASVEMSKLQRHSRCHTGERPYQCPHCTYASPDSFKLKRHLRTHTGEKPYKCDHCNMCFTQSNSLKSHKLTHNASQRPVYSCELCPSKCSRKTDLLIHVQNLHNSDAPLKCKRCGKTFPDRYSCKVHNKTHEGEKCFKCNVCSYESTTFRQLKSHMMKHSGEKPFSCDHCDQSFRQIQLLRRHQNQYHNPEYVPKPPKEKTHTCHVCNRNFAHKGYLIRHLAIHDPESDYYETSQELMQDNQKMVLPDKVQMKLDSNEEGSGDKNKDLNVYEKGNSELQNEEVPTVGETDEQYMIIQVIDLQNDNEEQLADVGLQYGEEEEQDENTYGIHDANEESSLLNKNPG